MYVITNSKDQNEAGVYNESDFSKKVYERVADIVPEDVHVRIKEMHITHARIFINGVNTHVDFKLLFPHSEVEWDQSQADPQDTMNKNMSDGKAE